MGNLKRIAKPILFLSWLIVAITGFILMVRYANVAGAVTLTPVQWPATNPVPFQAGKPNLVVFLHPKCSCSRATLTELDRLMLDIGDRVNVSIVFVKPTDKSIDWAKSDNWKRAKSIPGLHAFFIDQENKIAEAFGAETSGFTMLYSASGNLVFSGGITQ